MVLRQGMNSVFHRVFLVGFFLLAGCSKQVECPYMNPRYQFIGYTRTELANIVVSRFNREDFSSPLRTDTLNEAFLYYYDQRDTIRLEYSSLLNTEFRTSSFRIIVPSTGDQFDITENRSSIQTKASNDYRNDDCRSWVESVVLNGKIVNGAQMISLIRP